MTSPAHVTSVDALAALRAALLKFEAGARDAVTLLQLEVRRAVDWVEQDRRRYWPEQVKQASEQLVEARNELERCQLHYGSEEAPSCYEQRKRFERAKRRLRYCEEQVRVVKRWMRSLRQELVEFEGQLAQMTNCLDADLPRAITALSRMLGALQRYTDERRTLREAGSEALPGTTAVDAPPPDAISAAARHSEDSQGNSP